MEEELFQPDLNMRALTFLCPAVVDFLLDNRGAQIIITHC